MSNKSANKPEQQDWFSADRPILKCEEDKLGRRVFAEGIAAAIRGWKGRDSLVLALYGAWGTGKSSVKNMVIDVLREKKYKDNPTVAEFNPWQFANREQLTEAFFDQIGVALGRGTTGSGKAQKRILQRWRRYASYLRTSAGFADHIRKPLIAGLVVLALLAGITAALTHDVAIVISLVLLALAGLLKWSSKIAELVGALFEPGAELGRKSLEEVKEEIAKDLRKLSAPLLVVIDDVDRLIPAEIQELFQLIKVNADFPNVVYLVLFERGVVERNVEKVLEVKGREYLEKIVQVGFDMPVIEHARLQRILFEGLDELLAAEAISKRFDKHRWGNLYMGGLQAHFKTLRDVNRYLSTLSFQVSLFHAEGSFEVNPVDLIGLEVLRVFHPEVYRALAATKALLTVRVLRREGDEERQAINGIVEQAGKEAQSAVREIVKQLFPTVEWALGGTRYGEGFDEGWYRDLRVCSEDIFDRYFQLSIPEGDISQSVMDRILNAAGDRERLRTELLGLKAQGLLTVALDRLEAYKEKIPLEHAEPFVTAMFDVCDDLPDRGGGFFEISPMMHADRIIYWYLRREPDAERRRNVLQNAIQQTQGISLLVDVVSLEDQKSEKNDAQNKTLIDGDDLVLIKNSCVEKIQAEAASGRLGEIKELASILYRWKKWSGEAGPMKFVQNLVTTPDGAIKFLRAFLQRSTSHGMGDYVARERWYIRLKGVEEFVKWETIEAVLRDVSPVFLQETDRRAVEAFCEAAERRRRGKTDFGEGIDLPDNEFVGGALGGL